MHALPADLRKTPQPTTVILVTSSQGGTLEDIVGQAWLQSPHLAKPAQVLGPLIEDLELGVQALAPQEGAQVRVALVGRQLVKLQEALAEGLLQMEGRLHGLEASAPVVPLGPLEFAEGDDAVASVVQHQHEPFGELMPLVRGESPEGRSARSCAAPRSGVGCRRPWTGRCRRCRAAADLRVTAASQSPW